MFRTRFAVYNTPNDQGGAPPPGDQGKGAPAGASGLLGLGKVGDDGKPITGDDKGGTPDPKLQTPPQLKFSWTKDNPYEAALTLGDRPEGLPDELWDDKTKSVRVGSILKSRDDLRKQVSTIGERAPKSAADYKFEASDELKAIEKAVVNGPDDPLLKWFRETAYEKKLPQAVVNDLYNGFLKQASGLMPPTTTPEKELEALGPRGMEIVSVARARGQNLMKAGVFDEDDFAEYCVACGTASGVRMMQKLLESYGEPGMPTLLDQQVANSTDIEALDKELATIQERARAGDPKAQGEYERHLAKREQLFAGKR